MFAFALALSIMRARSQLAIIRTDCGDVVGFPESLLGYAFLCMPYATPPLPRPHAQRWRRSTLLGEGPG